MTRNTGTVSFDDFHEQMLLDVPRQRLFNYFCYSHTFLYLRRQILIKISKTKVNTPGC